MYTMNFTTKTLTLLLGLSAVITSPAFSFSSSVPTTLPKEKYSQETLNTFYKCKEKVQTICSSCHGLDGVAASGGNSVIIPNLTAQHKDYLVAKLKDYKLQDTGYAVNAMCVPKIMSPESQEKFKVEELLKTINGLDFKILNELKKGNIKKIWKNYNLNFLFFLGFGILSSIIILSQLMLINI